MKRTAAVFALCVAIALVVGGCSEEPKRDEHEIWYNEGYEDGYEHGAEFGAACVYESLVDDGVLKLAELVYLDFDRMVYHGYYCDLVNHDNETEKEDAEERGFLPCAECGGTGILEYIPVR